MIDWRPKSEPLPEDIRKSGCAYLVCDIEDDWIAFATPCDDGDTFFIAPDGSETSDYEDYRDEGGVKDAFTHWARITYPARKGKPNE